MGKVFGRYDEPAARQLFEDAGVLRALHDRGFHDFDVAIDDADAGLVRVQLFAHKAGRRHLLLEGCLTESIVRPDLFRARGYGMDAPVRLASVYWLREEDPTAGFAPDRPPLPLQRHPGLGVLRATFHVITAIARGCDFDGVACVPKFFHDAAIFYRSRLFLFLDGAEQGRFQALLEAAGSLSLNVASTRLLAGAVRDAVGAPVAWSPGVQVCPLSPRLVAYFHSPEYAQDVRQAYAACRFSWDNETGARSGIRAVPLNRVADTAEGRTSS
jgi:hypothetical protein